MNEENDKMTDKGERMDDSWWIRKYRGLVKEEEDANSWSK